MLSWYSFVRYGEADACTIIRLRSASADTQLNRPDIDGRAVSAVDSEREDNIGAERLSSRAFACRVEASCKRGHDT